MPSINHSCGIRWVALHLKSPANWMFLQQLVQANKELKHQSSELLAFHWNGNVIILMKFLLLAELEFVKMTTSSAASDENFIKMTFPSQCLWEEYSGSPTQRTSNTWKSLTFILWWYHATPTHRPGGGTHSMKVTIYAPPFRPPFFRSLENL